MNKERSRIFFRIVGNVLFLLIILSLAGLFLMHILSLYESPREVAEMIRGYGVLGPLIVVFLIALEVVVAPIPGVLIAVGTGFAFGLYWGTAITYAGNIIGTSIAFFLSRKFGRPLVERLVNKEKLELYDCFFRERGRVLLWLVFIFPIFPADIVSFMSGLTTMRMKDFMLIVCIAYIPHLLLLNTFGASLFESGFGQNTIFIGGFLLLVLVFGTTLYMFMKRRTMGRC